MTMARFAPGEKHADNPNVPAFVRFIWEVNEIAPDTFGKPEHKPEQDRPGYQTEHYPTARVIHGPGDEGVRIVADTEETAAVFRQAGAQLGIHVTASVSVHTTDDEDPECE